MTDEEFLMKYLQEHVRMMTLGQDLVGDSTLKVTYDSHDAIDRDIVHYVNTTEQTIQ